ncbi:peptidoglycan-associated lipoprotein Pal [Gammaproteobacteria bacterium]|nr:peptidoglycan-associated lipoprotein Pal [Gammaproteobacteria bacterium]
MIFSKFNISFLFIIIFLSSCSSMNVTEETVYSGDVKTVQATSTDNEDISYDSQAIFANATVYFDFDKTNLTSKSLQTLKSVVDALNDNSQLNIVLSGHADERGTREYNLALGQRRADTVSQYLILNGVESNRITTKSYGEERPIANGQDEASYAKNRRVQIN